MIAFITIPKEAEPDIPIPMLMVQVTYPGISPEDSERLLVKPLETSLAFGRRPEDDHRARL